MADGILTIPHLDRKALARIFSKIVVDPGTGCWLWTASGTTQGYGQIVIRDIRTLSHRFMFAWLVFPIPKGIGSNIPNLDHGCADRRCCNPAHLELVTPKHNTLRGNSTSALNARKTHCPNGHALPTTPNGVGRHGRYRRCRICFNASQRASYRLDPDKKRARVRGYEARIRAQR